MEVESKTLELKRLKLKRLKRLKLKRPVCLSVAAENGGEICALVQIS